MTVSPRFLAYLLIGFAPGCAHIPGFTAAPPAPPAQTAPPAPSAGDRFASLRPGEAVPARAVRVVPMEAAAKPAPPPDADPIPPASPDSVLAVAKTEAPAPFPFAAGPPVPDPPLLAAMRAYVENRPDDAIHHLEKLEKPNQEFALAVLPALARGAAMNLKAPDPQEAAHLAEQLAAAAARLEPKSALVIEKVAFCKWAKGFGQYEPWPGAQPYRANDPALLYVEVRNVGSVPAGDGYQSRLVVTLEVRDAKLNLVEQIDPTDFRRRVPTARFDHVDQTRSPPHDYFQKYGIRMPAQAGLYTVTVEVFDPAGGRRVRSHPVEFRVAGP